MIVFDRDELELGLPTYNRPEFIRSYLNNTYEDLMKRNIKLSIWDSSEDNKTKEVVDDFDKDGFSIEYHHVDSHISIGYKPMLIIYNSKAKYIWLGGDRNYIDFETFDERISSLIKYDIDAIVMSSNKWGGVSEGKLFSNSNSFLHDSWGDSTCLGMVIYKNELFNDLRTNKTLKVNLDQKFKDCYGLAWDGYFFSVIPPEGIYARVFIGVHPTIKEQSFISWGKRWLDIAINEFPYVINSLPDIYDCRDFVISHAMNEMFGYMRNDNQMLHYLLDVRLNGDLDYAKFKMDENSNFYEVFNEDNSKRIIEIAKLSREDAVKKLDVVKRSEKEEWISSAYVFCHDEIKSCKGLIDGRKIIVWGTGEGGKVALDVFDRELNLTPYAFVNSYNDISVFEGVKVVPFDEVSDKTEYYVLVATMNYYESIEYALEEENFMYRTDYVDLFEKFRK